MSNLINIHGTKEFTIAASDTLAIFSREPVKIYQKKTFTSFPDAWYLLTDIEGGTEYASSAFSTSVDLRIEASGAEVLYQTGVNATISERRGLRGQGTPGVLNATGALTAAMIASGIVTSTTATVAGTVPTGTVMDAAVEMVIGESIDWSVIKTGANAFTVTAATGHTLVGLAVVATATAGMFRTRKTAVNTFVTYRVG